MLPQIEGWPNGWQIPGGYTGLGPTGWGEEGMCLNTGRLFGLIVQKKLKPKALPFELVCHRTCHTKYAESERMEDSCTAVPGLVVKTRYNNTRCGLPNWVLDGGG